MSQFQWACNRLICEEEQITSEQCQDIDGEALSMKWRWQARNYDHNGKRNTVKRAWELHQQWRFDQWVLDCHWRFAIKHLQILCYTSYKHEDFYQWIPCCHERFAIKHLQILWHTIYKHTDNEKETQSGCNSKLGLLFIAPSYFILTIWSYHGRCRYGDVWIFEFIDHVKGQPKKQKTTTKKLKGIRCSDQTKACKREKSHSCLQKGCRM